MRTFLVWKQVFPSCCSNHRVLISLNWSVVSDFNQQCLDDGFQLPFLWTDRLSSWVTWPKPQQYIKLWLLSYYSAAWAPICNLWMWRQRSTCVCVGGGGLVICTSLEKNVALDLLKWLAFITKAITTKPHYQNSVWMFAGVSASLLTLCTVGQDGYTQGFWRRCQMDQGAQMGLHLVQTLCTGIRKKAFKTPYAINKTFF